MHNEATSSVERHLTDFFTVDAFLLPHPTSSLLNASPPILLRPHPLPNNRGEHEISILGRTPSPYFLALEARRRANYHSLVLLAPSTFYPQGYGQGRAGKESALGRPDTTFHLGNSPRSAQYKRQALLDLVAQTICPKLDNCCLLCQPRRRNHHARHGLSE